jgi:hypothetical protein
MLWRDLHPSQADNVPPVFISGAVVPVEEADMVPEYLPGPGGNDFEDKPIIPESDDENEGEQELSGGEGEDEEEGIPNMSRDAAGFRALVVRALGTLIDGIHDGEGQDAPITIQTPADLGLWRPVVFNLALRGNGLGLELQMDFWNRLVPWISNFWIVRPPKNERGRGITWRCRYYRTAEAPRRGRNQRTRVCESCGQICKYSLTD